jgi:hypothetical protein
MLRASLTAPVQHLSSNGSYLYSSACGMKIAPQAQYEEPHDRFRLIPFRSPLLREWANPCIAHHRSFDPCYAMRICDCFLFHRLLRCFTSAGTRAPGHPGLRSRFARPGFPIRTSPDQRLLATSPKLIAGCYVLHRLLVSRHPPIRP